MTSNDQSQETEELIAALEICRRSERSRNMPYKYWNSEGWLDVVDHFGEKKAQSMLAQLSDYERAFRDVEVAYLSDLTRRGVTEASFDFSDKVVSAFRQKHTGTPEAVLNALRWDYLRRHR